jgi:daunorubicin resistance ABC transporter ATP-binding subunit
LTEAAVSRTGRADAAVVAEGLRKRFKDTVALKGVDLRVEWGTIFALLGPNGAGKTTAIRILTTILRPDGGRARVAGFDVVTDATEVRFRIGLAGQAAAVDANLTGRENLQLIGRLAQLPRRLVAPRAVELLERFGLVDAADRPVRTYSGGMRRRLDVAAALVQRPPILFLDEPTTGLDPQSRNDLWRTIRELVAQGTSVVLTTQYLEEADRLAGRVAVVDRGLVIAEGTPAELKARMGSTVIELGLGDEERAIRSVELMSRLIRVQPERDASVVRLSSHDGPRLLAEVLRALDAEGLIPITINVREPSLDDVFLSLTGRHAEDTEQTIEAAAVASGTAAP